MKMSDRLSEALRVERLIGAIETSAYDAITYANEELRRCYLRLTPVKEGVAMSEEHLFTMNKLLTDVREELTRATEEHAKFNSAHEGWAVILEELDELWEQVRLKRQERNPGVMREEAIQIAAMAVRFALDICPPGT
jgi:hypothetical protein